MSVHARVLERETRKEELKQQRRAYSNELRRMGWDDYRSGFGYNTLRIGRASEEWKERWDYSEGDQLIYDSRVIPKAGDLVLYIDSDGFDLCIYEPISRRVGVKKVHSPKYDADGFEIPPEPELETVEKIDKDIKGVVMFDIRRRSMP